MANLEVLALDEATPQIRAPGSGDGYVMPRPLVLTTGAITTDVKQVDGTVTWNNAGVTFTGWKLNVTDTASNAISPLVDLQIGGTSQLVVRKNGLAMSISGHFVFTGTNSIPTWRAGLLGGAYGAGFLVPSDGYYAFSDNTNSLAGTYDARLYREATGTVAQRHTTTAQTFRNYRTYTDASNYQRLTHTWSTSTAVIHNEGAGTGADGSVAFNDAALATDATKGFVMIPSCAGTPTGTPADIPTGQVPIVFDSTNNKLYVYDGGWIATAALI